MSKKHSKVAEYPKINVEEFEWGGLKFTCSGHSAPGADFFSTPWEDGLRIHANYTHTLGNVGGKWHCFVEGTEGAVFVNAYHVPQGSDPLEHVSKCLEELDEAVYRQILRLSKLREGVINSKF